VTMLRRGPLQVMYGVDARQDLEEISLDHLSGYENSRPCASQRRLHQLPNSTSMAR